MSMQSCCVTGFKWEGTPVGRIDKLANNQTYVTGDNPDKAVLIIHDVFGWTFRNVRLLADHYAKEAGVTVYVPDYFGGEVLDFDLIRQAKWEELDIAGFIKRHSRENREPEVFDCARALRAKYKFVAAAGFCYGGWACFRLAAKEHQPPLVDCILVGHPSLFTKKDLDEIAMPTQFLAPEHDVVFTPEMKLYAFEALQKSGVAFDYRHFPGVEHSCFIRGDPNVKGEREALIKGKNAAVNWIKEHAQDEIS